MRGKFRGVSYDYQALIIAGGRREHEGKVRHAPLNEARYVLTGKPRYSKEAGFCALR